MDAKRNFIRTDLAAECREKAGVGAEKGVDFKERTVRGLKVLDMEIKTEEGSRTIGKDIGNYITVEVGKCWLMTDSQKDDAVSVIADTIKAFSKGAESVLAVGLGNRDVTPDALGPMTVDGLIVTRHIKDYNKELFDKIGQEEIAAIAPGVVGQTGIETFELIKGAVDSIKPQLVIVIDALAARSVDRLATTVQLSDTGIAPGSGIGNKRRKIDSESLGVPVIAIGVPTVVDSSTLVYDALDKAGIEEIDSSLENVLENSRSFFVSLKESDVAVGESAKLISDAINRAFCRL